MIFRDSRKLLFMSLLLVGLWCSAPSAHAAVKGAAPQNGGPIRSTGQVNAPQGTPTREIQDIETKMDAYKTGDNLTAEDRANNARIKREIITGTFDLNELCRLALDKHWGEISPAEQGNFVSLMTDLLETKAIFSKEQSKTKGKSYTVQYLGDTYLNDRTRAKTRTKVLIPKDNAKVDIEYRLKKGAGGWKIYDVVVDDASLVDNYRYQFDAIISKSGYAELVRRMQNKLKELRGKTS